MKFKLRCIIVAMILTPLLGCEGSLEERAAKGEPDALYELANSDVNKTFSFEKKRIELLAKSAESNYELAITDLSSAIKKYNRQKSYYFNLLDKECSSNFEKNQNIIKSIESIKDKLDLNQNELQVFFATLCDPQSQLSFVENLINEKQYIEALNFTLSNLNKQKDNKLFYEFQKEIPYQLAELADSGVFLIKNQDKMNLIYQSATLGNENARNKFIKFAKKL